MKLIALLALLAPPVLAQNPSSGGTFEIGWRHLTARIETTSPVNGEGDVALTRETVVTFSEPLDPGTVDALAFSVHSAGQTQPATVHLSPDGKRVTLFYDAPLPEAAVVRVQVDGDLLLTADGRYVDVDGDGHPGGLRKIDFTTLSLAPVPGTVVTGRVFASELAPALQGTPVNVPLEGVTITVDGAEETLFCVTDENGHFRLDPAPGGKFFVHVDGKTAVNPLAPGEYYPTVGKPWTPKPGLEVNVGDVFLPKIHAGALQPVSPTSDVAIGFVPEILNQFPEFAGTEITVPANSLFANDGTYGGEVGLGVVDPDRLPGELPDELDFPIVITVQSNGPTNFDMPAPVVFPNVAPDGGALPAPGEQLALFSFNHDAGRWEVVGTSTVSPDGLLVVSDPGSGIRAPGWHAVSIGSSVQPKRPKPSSNSPCASALSNAVSNCILGYLGTQDLLGCINSSLNSARNIYLGCIQDPSCGATCCGSKIANAVVDAALSCGKAAAKQSFLMKAWTTVACFGDITDALINGCKILGFLPVGPSCALEAAASELKHQVELLEDVVDFHTLVTGDPVWFQAPLDAEHDVPEWLDLWEEIGDATDELGDGSALITAAEETALLALPLPGHIPAASLVHFVERWNRTIDYWELGILELEDVPGGQSTDFIPYSEAIATAGLMEDALEEMQQDGHENVSDGVSQAFDALLASASDCYGEPAVAEPHFYAVELLEPGVVPVVQRGRTSAVGLLTGLILAPDSVHELSFLSPSTLQVGRIGFRTGPMGSTIQVPSALLYDDPGPDSDGDLISDFGEWILGSNPNDADTDGDGLDDGFEVQTGSDVLGAYVAQTGIIDTAPTPGPATHVKAAGDRLVVSHGTTGVSVFDVMDGQTPRLLTRVATPGTVVGADMIDDTLVVADGNGGAHRIGLLDPLAATIDATLSATELGGWAQCIVTGGGRAWVGTGSGNVVVLDVESWVVLDSVPLGSARVHDLFLGRYAVIVVTDDMLHSLSAFELPLTEIDYEAHTFTAPILTNRMRVFVSRKGPVLDSLVSVVHRDGIARYAGGFDYEPNDNDAGFQGWHDYAGVQSDLGFACLGPFPVPAGSFDASLLDDTNDETILATFPTPGAAVATSVASGLAYVADSDAGLQVVSFRAADTGDVPPTGSLWAVSPVQEGETRFIEAIVEDDVQIRDVVFLIDGQEIHEDSTYPFSYHWPVPGYVDGGDNDYDFSAWVTDTGGNTLVTPVETITVEEDTVPPEITDTSPGARETVPPLFSEVVPVMVSFSELMDVGTIDGTTVQLTWAGEDGSLDTGDDQVVAATVTTDQAGRVAMLWTDDGLAIGLHRLALTAGITDIAGNALDGNGDGTGGDGFTVQFSVVDQYDVLFTGGGDGATWEDPFNWNSLQVPATGERVLIDYPSEEVVLSSAATVHSLDVRTPLRATSSSSLTVTERSDLDQFDFAAPLQLDGAVHRLRDGHLSGAGGLTGNGDIRVTGLLNAAGTDVFVAPGSTVHVLAEGVVHIYNGGSIDGSLENSGEILFRFSTAMGTGALHNHATGHISTDGVAGFTTGLALTNEGTIVLRETGPFLFQYGTLVNTGTIVVWSEAQFAGGAASNDGVIVASSALSPATVILPPITHGQDSVLAGTGTFRFQGGNHAMAIFAAEGLQVSADSVTLGRFQGSTPVDLHLDGDLDITLDETGFQTGEFEWVAGRLEADITIPQGSTCLVSGSGTLAANLENRGTLTVEDGRWLNIESGQLWNAGPGTLELGSGASLFAPSAPAASLQNDGRIESTGASESQLALENFTNGPTGVVDALGGSLRFGTTGPGTTSFVNYGEIQGAPGTTLIVQTPSFVQLGARIDTEGTLHLKEGASIISGDIQANLFRITTGVHDLTGSTLAFTTFDGVYGADVTHDEDWTVPTLNLGSLVSGPGHITVTDQLNWTSGRVENGGLTLESTGTGTVTGGPIVFSQVINEGALTVDPGKWISVDGGLLENRAGASISLSSGSSLTWGTTFGAGSGTLTNYGTLESTSGSSRLNGVSFTNHVGGTIAATAGSTLTIESSFDPISGVNEGTLRADPGSTLKLAATSLTQTATGLTTGGGTVQLGESSASVVNNLAGTVDVTGTFHMKHGTNVVSGTLTAGHLQVSGGYQTLQTAPTITTFSGIGTAEFSIGQDMSVPDLTLTTGRVQGAGELTVTSSFAWSGGGVDGSLILAPTCTTTMTSGPTGGVAVPGTLENRGTFDQTGGQLNYAGGSCTNAAGATWTVSPGASFHASSPASFDNAGVLNLQPSGTTGYLMVSLSNSGSITALSGTAALEGWGGTSMSLSNDGELRAAPGATLRARCGTWTNDGDLVAEPGGTVLLYGDATLSATSRVLSHIDSTSSYGVVDFVDDVTLGGELDFDVDGSYTPVSADTFDVLTATTVTGTFATISNTDLGGGQSLQESYLADRVRMTVVP